MYVHPVYIQRTRLQLSLTHFSLASILWDIGKQYMPTSDMSEHVT